MSSARSRSALFLSVATLFLGLWHLREAVAAIMVFRQGEPLTSWFTIVIGPLSTLPAALTSFVRMKAAGWWLVIGATLSCLSFVYLAFKEAQVEALPSFLIMMPGPMLLAGTLMLVTVRRLSRSLGG
jgi:hypothetical protein